MTLERGAVETGVKIRVPRHVWIPQLVMGVGWLVLAAGYVWRDRPLPDTSSTTVFTRRSQ
jgi:hypothetical protein